MDIDLMRRQLLERVSENYADYRAELLLKDRQELIDGADRIARTAEVFRYFTEGWLKEAEIEPRLARLISSIMTALKSSSASAT